MSAGCVTLAATYEALSAKYLDQGIDSAAVLKFRSRCTIEGSRAYPLRYDELQPPYPLGAVRLAVLPIRPASAQQSAICSAADSILSAIVQESSFASYVNSPDHWHVTLFHSARLGDARPDALVSGGGINSALGGPSDQPPPDSLQLTAEVAAFEACLHQHDAFSLQVHSVIMADSGTVLLCCLDATGKVDAMRAALRKALPDAPAQQTSILHITLARLAGGAAGASDASSRAAVTAACERATELLRGEKFNVIEVIHVVEETFSTVQGKQRTSILLQTGN